MLTDDHAAWGHTSSTGLGFTHHTIVDAHFRACEEPYLALLARAGLRPGQHVLDAGCGPGDFLLHLAELVGPGGRITAVDLAEENAALAAQRTAAGRLPCPVEVRTADLLALPFPDDSFDAAWCANTVQYLDDEELGAALAELRRVVRPGGTVAVKDLDAHLITARPADPYLFADFFRTAGARPGYARQLLRTRELHRHLRLAGLTGVRRQAVLIEHHAPLTPAAAGFYKAACARLASQALSLGLDDEWRRFADRAAPDHPLDDPDGYVSEGNVLAVGTVPAGTGTTKEPAVTTAPPTDLSDLSAATDGLTITGLLRRNARDFPDHPALTGGTGPGAVTWTWSRLRAETAALAHGLAGLGLARGERVLIAMSKRPEHWAADLAAIHLGALACTPYDTLSTEQLRFIARHSAATVVLLEDEEQLRRWRPVVEEMDGLRAVVLVDADAVPADEALYVAYADLLRQLPDAQAFEELTDAATPDTPLTVVYTSGTTGDPKGVVISHRNAVHESLMQGRLLPVPPHPRTVAHLPLAHIAERALGIYMPVVTAGHVTLCEDPAQLPQTLRAVRPHAFFGVPRVWEKLAVAARALLAELPPERAGAVERARETAVEVHRLRSAGLDVPAELAARRTESDALLRPVRAALGLDECHRALSGAAPIPTAVLEFLAGLGISVYEVWGLSETTGAATVSTPEAFALGAVGRPGPGVEVRTGADGELFLRGPVVCAGYLRPDGGLDPATDAEGWLPTGDVGAVDGRGLVTVTDRKKELIITSGGKNIAPTAIESLLRAHPLIAQAVAVGDRRRYVTALLVLDEEALPTWARANGLDPAELATATARPVDHPAVRAAVAQAVAEANASLARVEQVKKHRLLPGPWTPESGELTPKLSLRRSAVAELHADVIESMYAGD
ncbi:AMP-binding protein [Kitasatospora sp. NPDC101183]|uniref:AMP-binding protein n=1 Tax=Kitasatospora sp. NPDC101183 TaxID=3364100 RepID=UPI00380DAFA0